MKENVVIPEVVIPEQVVIDCESRDLLMQE
jgi:hypothetical protein